MSSGGEAAGFSVPSGLDRRLETDGTPRSSAHLVQFYEEEEALAVAVAKFVTDGISDGDMVVTIATDEHTRAIHRHVRLAGVDLDAAQASGRLLSLDAHETLAKFMCEGEPDGSLFEAVVGRLVAERAPLDGGTRLRAYGEMVDVLWKRNEKSAALHLEELWNDLQTRRPFTLFCAYAMGQFYKEPATIHGVCAAHTQVIGSQPNRLRDASGPAQSLPPEYAQAVVREILHREEVELALRQALRELRSKEDELRRREEQLQDFLENGTVGLHRVGPDGRILWANRAELDLLGYQSDEYVGRSISDFYVDREDVADILARLTRGEDVRDHEARLRAKDGSIKHVLVDSSGYFRDGQFIHSRCFTRDITARRSAEEALRENERQLQLITDALPLCVSYIDREHRYQFVSAAYEEWFGRPRQDLVGRRVEDVIGAAAYGLVGSSIDRAFAGEPASYQGIVPFLDGRSRSVEATYIPQLDEEQRVVGVVALIADVSERKDFERFRAAAAARAERLLKITGALANAVTASEVFEAVVDHVAAAVDASSAALWLVEPDGHSIQIARSAGYPESKRERFDKVSLDDGPMTPAIDSIRRAEPIFIPSQAILLQQYPNLRADVTLGRSYRVCCLPLIAHGRVLGTLGLTIEETCAATEEEKDFLLLVARYASQAIERLRLFETERQSRAEADGTASHLGVLNRAARGFADAGLELDRRLCGVANELARALDGCINIALVEPDGLLRFKVVRHPLPEAQQILEQLASAERLRPGEGTTGGIAANSESVLFETIDPAVAVAHAPSAYRPFLERFPMYALVGAALKVRGLVIGTVTATRVRKGERYSQADLRLLEELAERAAVFIENSQLYQETLEGQVRAQELYRFAQAVMAADRVETVFEAALDSIERALGTNRSAILTCDDADVMRFRASRHLSDEYRRAVEGHSPWSPNASAPQPVLVPDVERDASLQPFLPLFKQEGIGSLAFIPLVTRGRLLGKFMVYYAGPHEYSSTELEIAVAIANHLASVSARFAAIAKLEDTIRYNDLFAGVLAHDLRSPLYAMMTAAQVLLMRHEGQSDGKNAKPITRIVTSGQRMTRMIEQLLDVTRARVGGGIQLEPSEVNFGVLCGEAVDELELAFPQWTIRRESVGDLDGTWDPDRLLQIISNLVNNAGQHGRPEGVVEVRLDGRERDVVTLEVRNGGVIPSSLLPTLFDPFRGTRQRRDASRGLGLGLFIVKEIARAHDGTVDVASTAEAGTTFVVRLPRRASRSSAFDGPPANGVPSEH